MVYHESVSEAIINKKLGPNTLCQIYINSIWYLVITSAPMLGLAQYGKVESLGNATSFEGSISGTELNSVGDFQNFGLTRDINFQSCILLPSFFKQTAKKTRVDLFLYRLALKNGLQSAT